jgi:predicted nucleic acid-binding protein
LRLQITEAIVAQADALAWKYGLRGYDAIHLASAVFWQEAMGEPVTLASFDRVLWQAAQKAAISAWPQDLE